VLVRAANAWLLLPTEHASVREDANIAGEPRDRLTFVDAVATAASTRQPLEGCDDPAALGALMRAIQITGVLERVLNQTVQYATERIQFGRPIGKFQAIQQQLAVLANEVVASRMAVASACAALSGKDWAQQAMIAKIICGLPPAAHPRSRTRCMAPSASRASTRCTTPRGACGPGAPSTAARRNGPRSSARWQSNTAATRCGKD
jgi:acyl-CoA dehydrogenase